MTHDMNQIIKLYEQSPLEFLKHLPDTSESANIIIDLLKMRQNDSELHELVSESIYLSPEHIIGSNYQVDEKLQLLNLMHLTSNFGLGSVIMYYESKYKKNIIAPEFDLNAHCTLLGSIIKHFNKVVGSQNWNNEYIINIAPAISDCATNVQRLDSIKLTGLLPLLYSLPKIEYLLSEQNREDFNEILESLDLIADHLYGKRKDNIIKIAQGLALVQDPNYWRACIGPYTQYEMAEYLLPVL